jgi:hypothetical protein
MAAEYPESIIRNEQEASSTKRQSKTEEDEVSCKKQKTPQKSADELVLEEIQQMILYGVNTDPSLTEYNPHPLNDMTASFFKYCRKQGGIVVQPVGEYIHKNAARELSLVLQNGSESDVGLIREAMVNANCRCGDPKALCLAHIWNQDFKYRPYLFSGDFTYYALIYCEEMINGRNMMFPQTETSDKPICTRGKQTIMFETIRYLQIDDATRHKVSNFNDTWRNFLEAFDEFTASTRWHVVFPYILAGWISDSRKKLKVTSEDCCKEPFDFFSNKLDKAPGRCICSDMDIHLPYLRENLNQFRSACHTSKGYRYKKDIQKPLAFYIYTLFIPAFSTSEKLINDIFARRTKYQDNHFHPLSQSLTVNQRLDLMFEMLSFSERQYHNNYIDYDNYQYTADDIVPERPVFIKTCAQVLARLREHRISSYGSSTTSYSVPYSCYSLLSSSLPPPHQADDILSLSLPALAPEMDVPKYTSIFVGGSMNVYQDHAGSAERILGRVNSPSCGSYVSNRQPIDKVAGMSRMTSGMPVFEDNLTATQPQLYSDIKSTVEKQEIPFSSIPSSSYIQPTVPLTRNVVETSYPTASSTSYPTTDPLETKEEDPKPSSNSQCLICYDRDATHLYVPCGHQCVCYPCSEKIKKTRKTCLYCNTVYQCIIRVYQTGV